MSVLRYSTHVTGCCISATANAADTGNYLTVFNYLSRFQLPAYHTGSPLLPSAGPSGSVDPPYLPPRPCGLLLSTDVSCMCVPGPNHPVGVDTDICPSVKIGKIEKK